MKTVVYKVLTGNDDLNGLKFESPPIDNSRVTVKVFHFYVVSNYKSTVNFKGGKSHLAHSEVKTWLVDSLLQQCVCRYFSLNSLR